MTVKIEILMFEPVNKDNPLGPNGAGPFLPPSAQDNVYVAPEIRNQARQGSPVAPTIYNMYVFIMWLEARGYLKDGDSVRHVDASNVVVTSRQRRQEGKGISIAKADAAHTLRTTSQLQSGTGTGETLVAIYAYATKVRRIRELLLAKSSPGTTVTSVEVDDRTILVQDCKGRCAIHVVGRHPVGMSNLDIQNWMYGAVEAVMASYLKRDIDINVEPELPYINGYYNSK